MQSRLSSTSPTLAPSWYEEGRELGASFRAAQPRRPAAAEQDEVAGNDEPALQSPAIFSPMSSSSSSTATTTTTTGRSKQVNTLDEGSLTHQDRDHHHLAAVPSAAVAEMSATTALNCSAIRPSLSFFPYESHLLLSLSISLFLCLLEGVPLSSSPLLGESANPSTVGSQALRSNLFLPVLGFF